MTIFGIIYYNPVPAVYFSLKAVELFPSPLFNPCINNTLDKSSGERNHTWVLLILHRKTLKIRQNGGPSEKRTADNCRHNILTHQGAIGKEFVHDLTGKKVRKFFLEKGSNRKRGSLSVHKTDVYQGRQAFAPRKEKQLI
jgi:hypothetical protein